MKQDRKRLSSEKHEIAYVRKLAREWMNGSKKTLIKGEGCSNIFLEYIPDASLKRLCNAVLKFTKAPKRKKR